MEYSYSERWEQIYWRYKLSREPLHFPVEVIQWSSNEISFCFVKMPDLSCSWSWVIDFQIKPGENNLMITTWMQGRMNTWKIKPIHEEEFCNMCICSLINWCSPVCEVILSIVLSSKVVLSLLYQFVDFRSYTQGLIHKLKYNGIDGNLLSLIEYFLHSRHQRVVLNSQSSKWQNGNAGVPQVFGLLCFLIYINGCQTVCWWHLAVFSNT